MIRSSEQMVRDAMAEIQTLSIEQAMALHGSADVLFVDIRDIRELEREGRIPGAIHAPRGMLEFWIDPAGKYHRKEFSGDRRLVFFCAAGWRSALATRAAQDMGLKNVCHIGGGFEGWKEAGGPVVPDDREQEPDYRPALALDSLTRLGHAPELGQQIGFILEIDRLKQIFRQTPLLDMSRKENDAEHSWQLAMMALVLAEYAPVGCDIVRVLKMVLIHDIVEIDAGDSPAYTGIDKSDQHERECRAADRLFNLVPAPLNIEFRELWDEFEQMKTPDALFARTMDRLQPFLHNYFTGGKMWIRHRISADQVRQRNRVLGECSPQLVRLMQDLTDDAVRRGYLLPGSPDSG